MDFFDQICMLVAGTPHDQKLSKRRLQLQRLQAFELSLMQEVQQYFQESCQSTSLWSYILLGMQSKTRKSMLQLQPDLTSRNLIADLQVKCTAPGCPFRGTFQEYESAHQQNCVIGRSGGLQNWMQSMKYAVDNVKQQPIKHFEVQNQNNQLGSLDEEFQWQKEGNVLDCNWSRSKERAQGKIKTARNKEDERFIECIPIDNRNQQQIECRQLDGGQRFTQIYFNSHPKLPHTNHRKGKRVIELQ